MSAAPGRFISVEGTEGSGKTSLIEFLARHLEQRGLQILTVREPGDTELGERVRTLLLKSLSAPCLPQAEMLLFFAARAQLLAERIEPALESGQWVLCDRFLDSSHAYQVRAGGANQALFDALTEHLDIRWPDRTLVLDLEAEEGLRRIGRDRQRQQATTGDSFERRGAAFLREVCADYRHLAELQPERVRLIDATRSPEAVQRQALQQLSDLIAAAGP